MPKILYCWRCEMEMPMLDEQEWRRIWPAEGNLIQAIKNYQTEHGVTLDLAREGAAKEILARYKDITGFEETNVNALWHHRIDLYGPPCHACGKVLRTPVARRCVECGTVRSNQTMGPTR